MRIPGFLALLGLAALFPSAGHAGLEICNDTEARQTVSIGYKSGDNWVSEGWWNIDAGACKVTVSGDLKQRYYYFLSKSSGWNFDDENIAFCTTSEVFTITGDQNCAGRGYDKSHFRKIDTGKTAKEFTQFLSSFTTRNRSAPTPAPDTSEPDTSEPDTSEPGTWGEPYASGGAVFQACETDTDAAYCTFHDNGYKFFVYDDGRTPPDVMRALRGYLPGTPVELSGDLESVYDRTADIVLRRVVPRPWNNWDSTLGQMQGQWYSVDDPASMFTVLGAERVNTYDGAIMGVDYLSMGDSCDTFQGARILSVRDESTGDTLCYSIDEMSDWEMTWMYLPRGNFHAFRKLD